ncbi:class I SAM-dependent methyltransferase [Aquisalimonas asiatica]|uniref:Methyltransferase domain-containing protein n=1 Tax=Aquisalimonas asiatica TaxID=406100 RepID=A0A1H8SNA5_9GAMM|nr:class I SAM-dependent methyltransferase [Aquisalimonas asiatica]SEO80065.1 hypothetical protein SAMN04488052_10385 [Aquisalimonas asiatica]
MMSEHNDVERNATEAAAPGAAATPENHADGTIKRGGESTAVRLSCASRYSLWLTYRDDPPHPATGTFDSLTFETDAHTIALGACQVLDDADAPQNAYRLVPMASIHDFQKLFHQSRADVLDMAARNLPLILQYRNNIDPAFRTFVGDVAYDISVYKELFDRLDAEYAGEPEPVREVIQQGLIRNTGQEFIDCLNAHVADMEHIIADYEGEQHSQHGYYLRKQLWGELLTAPFMARTNLKPRGYIGDSEMMQMCYRNTYEGDSTFGKLLHHHPVSSAAAQAVRNRRPLVARMAGEYADRMGASADNRMRLLSVACGPALELHDLLNSRERCQQVEYSLLDQDELALGEAAAALGAVEKRLQTPVKVNYIQESVRTLLATRALRESWGEFHFIYSMGLFDYLTPPVAKAVLSKLHALLLPGGEMAIGNFHVTNPTRRYMDYWLDWPLYYRTEADFLALTEDFDDATAWIEYDETGVQMLLRIRKATP